MTFDYFRNAVVPYVRAGAAGEALWRALMLAWDATVSALRKGRGWGTGVEEALWLAGVSKHLNPRLLSMGIIFFQWGLALLESAEGSKEAERCGARA